MARPRKNESPADEQYIALANKHLAAYRAASQLPTPNKSTIDMAEACAAAITTMENTPNTSPISNRTLAALLRRRFQHWQKRRQDQLHRTTFAPADALAPLYNSLRPASQRIMDDALVIEASLRLGYLLANTNTEHPAPSPTTPPPDALTDSIIAVAGPDIATITVIEALATRMITDHPGEAAHIINRIARNKRATQLRPSRVMPEHLAKLQAKFATISTQANTTQRKQKNAPRSTASEGANPTKTP